MMTIQPTLFHQTRGAVSAGLACSVSDSEAINDTPHQD
ncbi:hypothetical protein CKO_01230 [Citrobacter koseri ATCC BAA-895]|uniref:Uncharacterized protein n=1 Tax=Citrobacter koseri (strain ATCC BAA-895 / CDC 4225-83 / SGSC4696) TaxID=290338 RepID=A8AFV6_CITK8|nr:hypothetical protein CKO_01230 [Citrobacter koseri ATCC BAA-895]